jgi:hypothetical protein
MAGAHRFSLSGFIVSWIARLFYLASLTAIIPFAAFLLANPLEAMPDLLSQFPVAALILFVLSIIILFVYHHNIAHTLAALGWMALLPGFGGLVFMLVPREAAFAFLKGIFSGFAMLEPFVAAVQQALPWGWLFVIGYIVIGLALVHIAGRMDSDHALTTHLKKIFGPRVRILRSH